MPAWMKITPAAAWNITGLILVLVGVLILFRYGMPYRARRGGARFLVLAQKDEADLKQERRYDVLGWVGLVLVVVGTGAQIIASLSGS